MRRDKEPTISPDDQEFHGIKLKDYENTTVVVNIGGDWLQAIVKSIPKLSGDGMDMVVDCEGLDRTKYTDEPIHTTEPLEIVKYSDRIFIGDTQTAPDGTVSPIIGETYVVGLPNITENGHVEYSVYDYETRKETRGVPQELIDVWKQTDDLRKDLHRLRSEMEILKEDKQLELVEHSTTAQKLISELYIALPDIEKMNKRDKDQIKAISERLKGLIHTAEKSLKKFEEQIQQIESQASPVRNFDSFHHGRTEAETKHEDAEKEQVKRRVQELKQRADSEVKDGIVEQKRSRNVVDIEVKSRVQRAQAELKIVEEEVKRRITLAKTNFERVRDLQQALERLIQTKNLVTTEIVGKLVKLRDVDKEVTNNIQEPLKNFKEALAEVQTKTQQTKDKIIQAKSEVARRVQEGKVKLTEASVEIAKRVDLLREEITNEVINRIAGEVEPQRKVLHDEKVRQAQAEHNAKSLLWQQWVGQGKKAVEGGLQQAPEQVGDFDPKKVSLSNEESNDFNQEEQKIQAEIFSSYGIIDENDPRLEEEIKTRVFTGMRIKEQTDAQLEAEIKDEVFKAQGVETDAALSDAELETKIRTEVFASRNITDTDENALKKRIRNKVFTVHNIPNETEDELKIRVRADVFTRGGVRDETENELKTRVGGEVFEREKTSDKSIGELRNRIRKETFADFNVDDELSADLERRIRGEVATSKGVEIYDPEVVEKSIQQAVYFGIYRELKASTKAADKKIVDYVDKKNQESGHTTEEDRVAVLFEVLKNPDSIYVQESAPSDKEVFDFDREYALLLGELVAFENEFPEGTSERGKWKTFIHKFQEQYFLLEHDKTQIDLYKKRFSLIHDTAQELHQTRLDKALHKSDEEIHAYETQKMEEEARHEVKDAVPIINITRNLMLSLLLNENFTSLDTINTVKSRLSSLLEGGVNVSEEGVKTVKPEVLEQFKEFFDDFSASGHYEELPACGIKDWKEFKHLWDEQLAEQTLLSMYESIDTLVTSNVDQNISAKDTLSIQAKSPFMKKKRAKLQAELEKKTRTDVIEAMSTWFTAELADNLAIYNNKLVKGKFNGKVSLEVLPSFAGMMAQSLRDVTTRMRPVSQEEPEEARRLEGNARILYERQLAHLDTRHPDIETKKQLALAIAEMNAKGDKQFEAIKPSVSAKIMSLFERVLSHPIKSAAVVAGGLAVSSYVGQLANAIGIDVDPRIVQTIADTILGGVVGYTKGEYHDVTREKQSNLHKIDHDIRVVRKISTQIIKNGAQYGSQDALQHTQRLDSVVPEQIQDMNKLEDEKIKNNFDGKLFNMERAQEDLNQAQKQLQDKREKLSVLKLEIQTRQSLGKNVTEEEAQKADLNNEITRLQDTVVKPALDAYDATQQEFTKVKKAIEPFDTKAKQSLSNRNKVEEELEEETKEIQKSKEIYTRLKRLVHVNVSDTSELAVFGITKRNKEGHFVDRKGNIIISKDGEIKSPEARALMQDMRAAVTDAERAGILHEHAEDRMNIQKVLEVIKAQGEQITVKQKKKVGERIERWMRGHDKRIGNAFKGAGAGLILSLRHLL